MRLIRISVVIFFVISCMSFGAYKVYERMHSDHNAPTIQVEQDILEISAKATDVELLKGVTASDMEDGDLTARVQVASMSPLLEGDQRTVQYIVFDDAGQLGTASRTIVYKDYISPRIYMKKPFRFTEENAPRDLTDMGVVAEDCIDGDISWKVRWTNVNILSNKDDRAEKCEFTFQVNNNAGDTRVVTVEADYLVREEEMGKYYPMLTDYIVYTKVNEELDLEEYLSGMIINGQEYEFGTEKLMDIHMEDIILESDINYKVPGVYTAEYSYTTLAEITAVTTLYVVVEE